MFPQFYDHLNEWINLVPFTLNAKKFELFHQYGASLDKKAAENDPELLERARVLGSGLIDSTRI